MTTIRPPTLVCMVCLAITTGFLVFLPGCATFRSAIRTVNDLAKEACLLFGEEHPAELRALGEMAAPQETSEETGKVGFNPKALCIIPAVLDTFLQDQMRLQQETAFSIRQSMDGGVDATAPQ